MKIVVMADNRKNELLVNFCIAYRQLLSKHTLISLHNTATLLDKSLSENMLSEEVFYLDREQGKIQYLVGEKELLMTMP